MNAVMVHIHVFGTAKILKAPTIVLVMMDSKEMDKIVTTLMNVKREHIIALKILPVLTHMAHTNVSVMMD